MFVCAHVLGFRVCRCVYVMLGACVCMCGCAFTCVCLLVDVFYGICEGVHVVHM